MAVEKPLDIEMFFQSHTAVATEHNDKLEIQAMNRIREHMLEAHLEEQKANTPVASKETKKK